MLFRLVTLHIPDGFLTPGVCLLGWVLAVAMLHLAIRHSREQLGERQVPFMGVMAAFIFAAQAINFPVVGGTSGHILGGALAGILIGPWAGTLMMTAVLIVQGLLFQDGGLLSMGWNIMNMGAASVLTGYAVHSLILRLIGEGSRLSALAGFLAAWVSVEAGAVATALELAASGTYPLQFSLPALTAIYGLIGVAEGVVTVAALGFVRASYPELLRGRSAPGRVSAIFVTYCLAAALLLALLSPIASSKPDGLETVARTGGFAELEQESLVHVFPDYTISLFQNPSYSTVVAIIIGTLIMFGVAVTLGHLVRKRRK